MSSQLAQPYAADLVRVRHADPNPDGPGMKLIPVPAPWAGDYPSVAKPVPRGSYGRAEGRLDLGDAFTLLLRVQPRKLRGTDRPQVLLALTGAGRSLVLRADTGGITAEAMVDGQGVSVASGARRSTSAGTSLPSPSGKAG
ncbi:hypothetical protein ACFQU2_16025 [Siccirubricoccus deserti]